MTIPKPETVAFVALAAIGAVTVLAYFGGMVSHARRSWIRRQALKHNVQLGQVTACARKQCPLCKGSGIVRRIDGTGPNAPRREAPCGCATRRFMKAHEGKYEYKAGLLRWKRGYGPGPYDADASSAGLAAA